MWSARAAMYVLWGCLATNAVSFFGGFSTFDTAQSHFRAPRAPTIRARDATCLSRSPPGARLHRTDLTFHSVSGLLLALTVINKGHYLYLWYIVLVFSAPQLLVDSWTLFSLLVVGRKRRW